MGWSLSRSKSSFYYFIKLAGVTRNELGVTAHGLRHEFAAELYQHHAQERPPVEGGEKVALEIDRMARTVVTEALGHSRLSITSAYLGSIPGMSRERRSHLNQLNNLLCSPTSQLTFACNAVLAAFEENYTDRLDLRIWIVGREACGELLEGMPLIMAAGMYFHNGLKTAQLVSATQLFALADAAAMDLERRCMVDEEARVSVHDDKFELMLVLG